MIETYLRPLYQFCIINPIVGKIPFSPAKITYGACLMGVLVAPSLILGLPILAIILLLISGFLDTLDGSVARRTNSTSSLGSLLDIVSDRIVELAVILGLFFIDPTHRAVGALAMLGSCYLCITCFLTVGVFTQNQSQKGFHYSAGLMERAEAFLFFIAMIIWPQHFSILSGLFTGLVLLTSSLHIRQFIKFNKTR